jgi:hypothetical protein
MQKLRPYLDALNGNILEVAVDELLQVEKLTDGIDD